MKHKMNNKTIKNLLYAIKLIIILVVLHMCHAEAKTIHKKYDIVIAGAGTGGWGAAIQSARMGCSVLLIEETDWIGGQMNAAGVTSMDEGTIIREQGLYHEFYERVVERYNEFGKSVGTCYFKNTTCAFEPRIGQRIMYEFINELNKKGPGHIEVSLRSHIVKVDRDGNVVRGADIEIASPTGRTTHHVDCTILVDATEYGDILPLAGVRYRVGKCTSDNIDPMALMQDNTWTAVVKEYPKGIPFKLKITSPPPGYDDARQKKKFYRIQVVDPNPQRQLGFADIYAEVAPWQAISRYRGMPDSSRKDAPPYPIVTRTHLNIPQNDVGIRVGDCEYPAQRWSKGVEMRLTTLQLLYYLQNELKLPWSVADDEGYDTPYNREQIARIVTETPSLKPFERVLQLFPPIAYVRESRRMIGLHTVVAGEIHRLTGPKASFSDAISVNDYPEDLHGSKSTNDMELNLETAPNPKSENLPWSIRGAPFQLPFRAFIPESVDGFLAAEKNISQSRLVNGATRLQPSTMINGQAVGAIAALAIKNKIQPRAVDPGKVQSVMLDAGVQLVYDSMAVPRNSKGWKEDQLSRLHTVAK
jgi:hypothetical protein